MASILTREARSGGMSARHVLEYRGIELYLHLRFVCLGNELAISAFMVPVSK